MLTEQIAQSELLSEQSAQSGLLTEQLALSELLTLRNPAGALSGMARSPRRSSLLATIHDLCSTDVSTAETLLRHQDSGRS
jgi:hypothetical protein